jgi:hypothetical protein
MSALRPLLGRLSPDEFDFQVSLRPIFTCMAQENSASDSSVTSGLFDKLKGLVTDKMGIALILALLAAGAVTFMVVF